MDHQPDHEVEKARITMQLLAKLALVYISKFLKWSVVKGGEGVKKVETKLHKNAVKRVTRNLQEYEKHGENSPHLQKLNRGSSISVRDKVALREVCKDNPNMTALKESHPFYKNVPDKEPSLWKKLMSIGSSKNDTPHAIESNKDNSSRKNSIDSGFGSARSSLTDSRGSNGMQRSMAATVAFARQGAIKMNSNRSLQRPLQRTVSSPQLGK